MRTRRLGSSDLHLTTIGLGTWAMGGGGWKWGWGPQDDQLSISTIHSALEIGINWIDTAPIYGFGRAEEVIGQALTGLEKPPYLVSKCGRVWDDEQNVSGCLDENSIRMELERSLKYLKTDRIDLYLMHYPLPEEDMESGWQAMVKLVEEGTVGHIGVSNATLAQIKRLNNIYPVACIQPAYSMVERSIESEIIQFCKDAQIGILAYSPMQRGLLTGKFSLERILDLPEDDHRKRDKHFAAPELSLNIDLVESLSDLAERHGQTAARLAIAWVLRNPAVTAAIVGARHPQQIMDTGPAADWVLDQQDNDTINRLLQHRAEEMERTGLAEEASH